MPLPRHNFRIRSRIALSVCTVTVVLMVAMSVAVFGVFQEQLNASLDDTLGLRAEANRQLLNLSGSTPQLTVNVDPGNELLRGEAILRLFAPDGTLLSDAVPSIAVSDVERALVIRVARAPLISWRRSVSIRTRTTGFWQARWCGMVKWWPF